VSRGGRLYTFWQGNCFGAHTYAYQHFILKLWAEGEVGVKHSTKETSGYVVNGLSFVLFFFLVSIIDVPGVLPLIIYLAWVLFGFGLVLIGLSIAALVSHREAGLIEWGVYGIVRHPMYLGAMVLFLSWIFFLPHWIIVLISSVNIAIVYWFILQGERQNTIKFGDTYRRYIENVPRINLLAGLIRRLQRRLY
jgi:protein-S-isoprenylcysteine O-methyltransferase Ste14